MTYDEQSSGAYFEVCSYEVTIIELHLQVVDFLGKSQRLLGKNDYKPRNHEEMKYIDLSASRTLVNGIYTITAHVLLSQFIL